MTTVVFFHGALSLIEEYAPLLDAIDSAGSVKPFAAPGHGRPLGHPLRMREWVDAAADFVDDVGPCVLVGHSAGGHVALHVAATRRDGVLGVVCLDTPLSVRRDVLSTPEARRFLRSLANDPRLADAAFHLATQNFDTFFEGFDEDALAYDIDCPVLMIGADPVKGSLLTPEDTDRAKRRIPAMAIERVEGVGHMFGIETGDVSSVTALIRRFLVQLRRQGG